MSDLRPNPDTLLTALRRDEARARRGKLKIYFGMCPGVGKTYAMLRQGQRDAQEKIDVAVGVVETHGRRETEALLTGLSVIPRKEVLHHGISLGEFDLEATLARRPRLVLLDELAHTNAPGSRHPKRYQDLIELLDAGIDVYTTLNVQHLESRADAVRQITGAQVHETVPDSVIELADQIEIVDLTPEALRVRLDEGKVYLGERAATAAENFFKPANLTALRELALRFVAERVDTRLRELRSTGKQAGIWRSGERLMVAVGPSPFSTQLVRWTRRMAAAQGAAWLAVSVESSRLLEPEAQRRLEQNLSLARELGAEVVVTHDDDLARALLRVAAQYNATQVVVGKSHAPWYLDLLRGGSLADRLLRRRAAFDVHVVPAERAAGRTVSRLGWALKDPSSAGEYVDVAIVLAGLTAVAWFAAPHTGYLAIGLLYLLAVVGLSLRVGRWPVLASGVVSALAWNFLFIPPIFTFAIQKFEDGMMFGAYFVVALIAGQLTARIRRQEKHERLREERATALFHLTQALSAARNLDEAVFAALRQTDALFAAESALLLGTQEGGRLAPHFANSFSLSEKERGVAEWSWRNRKKAGRFTDTLPAAEGFYVPLAREDASLGVLGLKLREGRTLTLAQRDLAESFAAQLAIVVESEQFRAASAREKLLAESEKLHRVLLDGVSHELRTPLSVISSALENLGETPDAALRSALLDESRMAVRRLNRVVGNLLDQTRLESGTLRPKLDWCDPRDIVNAALESVRDALVGHPVQLALEDAGEPIRTDFSLTEQAIANLLVNASVHTPAATPVFVTAGLERGGTRAFFTIADRGPGFPPEMRARLFQKFSRGDAARAGGLGLGLSIARGFVAAQGGELVVGENPGGGAVFTLYLPHRAPPPSETSLNESDETTHPDHR